MAWALLVVRREVTVTTPVFNEVAGLGSEVAGPDAPVLSTASVGESTVGICMEDSTAIELPGVSASTGGKLVTAESLSVVAVVTVETVVTVVTVVLVVTVVAVRTVVTTAVVAGHWWQHVPQ